MSISSICGYAGSITGISGVTEVTEWVINLTNEALDATSMDSLGFFEAIACLKGATGTIKCLHRFEVGPYATTTFVSASGKWTAGGAINVTKVTCNTPVDGIVTFTGDLVFTGKITITNATA